MVRTQETSRGLYKDYIGTTTGAGRLLAVAPWDPSSNLLKGSGPVSRQAWKCPRNRRRSKNFPRHCGLSQLELAWRTFAVIASLQQLSAESCLCFAPAVSAKCRMPRISISVQDVEHHYVVIITSPRHIIAPVVRTSSMNPIL